MVQINFAQKTVNVKIVYYGPGMSGKTTNLEVIHQRAPEENRGELTSISTDGDRTLFFDFMPLDLGTVAGMRTQFQIYTVPGQVYYNSTRKLVLQGVDGVIFVADSGESMLEQNLQSLHNLEENLNEYGKSLATLPHVIQFNKRDLPDAMSTEELSRHLNLHKAPIFEAVANSGQGVFPTLKSLAANVLKTIMEESGETASSSAFKPKAPAAPAAKRAPLETTPAPMPIAEPDGNLYSDLDTRTDNLSVPTEAARQHAIERAEVQSATATRQAQRRPLMTPESSTSTQRRAKPQAGLRGSAIRRPVESSASGRNKSWVTPVAVGAAAVLGAAGAWLVLNLLG